MEIDIPAFIRQVARRDFEGAFHTLFDKNMLPAICGRVCPQEDQCEPKCTLGGSSTRWPSDGWSGSSPTTPPRGTGRCETPAPASTGQKVAVVGSGPAGLTCAADLRAWATG